MIDIGLSSRRLHIVVIYKTPIDVCDTDFEVGVGGCESILILATRALAMTHHYVYVYSHTSRPGTYHGVEWRSLHEWEPNLACDVTIGFRCPEIFLEPINSLVRMVLIGDRKCPGLAEVLIGDRVNLVVCLSEFMQAEVSRQEKVTPDKRWRIIPSGTELSDYVTRISKRRGQCFYASAPYRGLEVLLNLWPKIKNKAPHAQLIVSSSYLLWGHSLADNTKRTASLYATMDSLRNLDVTNVVCLPRPAFVQLQMESQVLLYPCTYDEGFCITALEASAAGAVIISSMRGSLQDRVDHGRTGMLIPGDPYNVDFQREFVHVAVDLLNNDDRLTFMGEQARQSVQSYHYKYITAQWINAWNTIELNTGEN